MLYIWTTSNGKPSRRMHVGSNIVNTFMVLNPDIVPHIINVTLSHKIYEKS